MTQKLKFALFLLIAVFIPCFFIFTAAFAQSGVVISQVQISGGPGKTNEDFIELYNQTASPFNLKGYRLVKRTETGTADISIKSWTADTFIPANSFFLWANSGYASISVVPDEATSGTLANDNGIALRLGAENSGAIMDGIAWGTANNGFTNVYSENPGAGQSFLKQDVSIATSFFAISSSSPRNSSVTYGAQPEEAPQDQPGSATTTPDVSGTQNLPNNQQQQEGQSTTTPNSTEQENSQTPSSENTPQQSGSGSSAAPSYLNHSSHVKISEILPNPEGEDEAREQIEIFNGDSRAVSLEGWILGDKSSGPEKSTSYKLPAFVIQPGSYLVVTLPKGSFVMNNSSGETVNLYFSDKTTADFVSYESGVTEGESYQRIGGKWVWGVPSLGSVNIEAFSNEDSSHPADAQQAYPVAISEFMPNPAGSDEGKEWVVPQMTMKLG